MINSVTIKNFQSHQETNLEFLPGVNVISGKSDCGKSSVMRALLYCIKNNLPGDSFVSNWSKDKKGKQKDKCFVSVDVGNLRIEHYRNSTGNGYEVTSSDGTVSFEALRGNVPDQVSKGFNIGDVNIQSQLDGPFMLSSTPGENARMINELVNLSDIDDAMTFVNQLSRDCTSKIKEARASKESIESSVSKYSDVDELNRIMDRINEVEKAGTFYDSHANYLDSSLSQYLYIEGKITDLKPVSDEINIELMDDINTKISEIEIPETKQYEEIVMNLEELQNIPETTLIESCNSAYQEALSCFKKLIEEDTQMLSIKTDIRSLTTDIEKYSNELDKMVCPLCGRAKNEYRDNFR